MKSRHGVGENSRAVPAFFAGQYLSFFNYILFIIFFTAVINFFVAAVGSLA